MLDKRIPVGIYQVLLIAISLGSTAVAEAAADEPSVRFAIAQLHSAGRKG